MLGNFYCQTEGSEEMIKHKDDERRLYPRIEARLPLRIAANGYDLVTNTQNISCLGAYCHIEKYIPPFTKILIKLSLPVADKERATVECRGVVVRSQDASSGGFNIAIFFNHINESQRLKISQYLNQFLPQFSPAH